MMGLGGTACVLYLLLDNSNSSLGNPSNKTAKTEPVSYSNTASTTNSSVSRENASTPSSVADIVFSKHAFARKATITFWAESLTEDQALTRLDQATSPSWRVSSADRIDLQTVLLQKLSLSAPERALKFALARDEQEHAWMVKVIFGIWASTHLDDAIVRAKKLDDHLVQTALSAILSTRDDLPLDRHREIAKELGRENVAFINYFEHLTRSPIKNPKDTWSEIVDIASQEGLQVISQYRLSRLGVAWVNKEGMAALDEIRTSLPADFNSTLIFSMIFSSLAENAPQETFDYVINNFADQARELIQDSSLLSKWARSDPLAMIAAVRNVPGPGFPHQLFTQAVSEWAESNPRHCLEHMEQIPRAYRLEARRTAIRVIARTSPAEAAEYVLNTPGSDSRRWSAEFLVQQWSDQDVDGAVGWVRDLPEEDPMRFELIESLAFNLVYTDPEVAFQLALEQPIKEERHFPSAASSLESRLLNRIAQYDLDLALELLPQVRDVGHSKVSAYTYIGSSLFEQGEAEQAISLANELSAKQQTRYFFGVVLRRALRDPNGLIEVFDDFPNELKSKVALTIRVSARASRTLSAEEIAWLESHFSDEETVLLNELKDLFMSNRSPEAKDILRAEKLREFFSL